MTKRILYLNFIILLLISCEKEIKYIVKDEFKKEFIDKGKEATGLAFNELSKNLKTSITNSGFEGAVSFCNVESPKIMKKITFKSKALVKRVSDNPRNQKNAASEREIEIMNNYRKLIKLNEKLEPVLDADRSVVTFYAPIKIMPLCLNCHGNYNSQIGNDTKDILLSLYPEDKAVNYNIDDLRGLWKVVFPKQLDKIDIED
jgi:hypothetical protein